MFGEGPHDNALWLCNMWAYTVLAGTSSYVLQDNWYVVASDVIDKGFERRVFSMKFMYKFIKLNIIQIVCEVLGNIIS